jgi:hypothetical protein
MLKVSDGLGLEAGLAAEASPSQLLLKEDPGTKVETRWADSSSMNLSQVILLIPFAMSSKGVAK